MSEILVYVDRSSVREGALEELRPAIAELAEFVQANVLRVLSYSVYFSDDGREMTVVHVHPDAASLDDHLEIAGPRFAPFRDLVTLSGITIYGRPSAQALRKLEEKLTLLGSGEVVVQTAHAGFSRPGSAVSA
jgi:quinol monooxygenase YgiN